MKILNVKNLAVVIGMIFGSIPCNVRGCDELLWNGIHDELHYNHESQFQADLTKVILMTREQREEYLDDHEGEISLGLLKLLELGIKWDDNDKTVKSLKDYHREKTELTWKSSEYTDFRLKLVNPKVVEAWQECIRNQPGGIKAVTSGDESRQFILNVRYVPENDDVPDTTVKAMNIVGGSFLGAGSLTAGSSLKRFEGLSAIVIRDEFDPLNGLSPLSVVVEFEGRPPVTFSLKGSPPPAQEVETPVKKTVSAFGGWKHLGGGDKDMHTTGNDRVPVRSNAKLETVGDQVVLILTFHCDEDGGDNTRFGGTREFPLYSAARGNRIVSVSAPGGLECSLTGGTRRENHRFNTFDKKEVFPTFWKKAFFRVDSKSDNDSSAVGMGGDLEFTVVTIGD